MTEKNTSNGKGGSRRPIHVAVTAAIAGGLYVTTLAGVTFIQDVSDRAKAEEAAQARDAQVAALRDQNNQLEDSIRQAESLLGGTAAPSTDPTADPTLDPTADPNAGLDPSAPPMSTPAPTKGATGTTSPTSPTRTAAPTPAPTAAPTKAPTPKPTVAPTKAPTPAPTTAATTSPSGVKP